ncbi:cancer-related nucleoside-triphosphatase isoform X3 [Anomalospiza imberbis]|uniref:cancer-related nucleoside-triphosphatase isoform X3 n=1 Tax=Anomalospiza imberbis TaxID=187417 RepID=UPI00358F331E
MPWDTAWPGLAWLGSAPPGPARPGPPRCRRGCEGLRAGGRQLLPGPGLRGSPGSAASCSWARHCPRFCGCGPGAPRPPPPPWVGKTTLIQKVTQALKSSGVPVDGFYTQEVREGGRRTGFDVVTLSGNRGPLSRVSSDSSASRREYRVGQYVVDLVSFEQLVLPMLRNVSKENRNNILQDILAAVESCRK